MKTDYEKQVLSTVYFLISGKFELNDVAVLQENGDRVLKPVLGNGVTFTLLNNEAGKISIWYNSTKLFHYFSGLIESVPDGQPVIFKFHKPLLNGVGSSFYLTSKGITAYEAQRNIKYQLKTSSSNLKILPDHLPEIASLEEANAFGMENGLGTFFVKNATSSALGEDPDFDPQEALDALRKRKLQLERGAAAVEGKVKINKKL